MKVINIHQRSYDVAPEKVGALIDTLSSANDRLWPHHSWPEMKFDRPLSVGAAGGHGPVGYTVEEYQPGSFITFRFSKPTGFDGIHTFELLDDASGSVVLRHTIDMDARGSGIIIWALMIRPMHDALLEDCLATAEASLGIEPKMTPWPLWVKILRWLLTGGKTRPQATLKKAQL